MKNKQIPKRTTKRENFAVLYDNMKIKYKNPIQKMRVKGARVLAGVGRAHGFGAHGFELDFTIQKNFFATLTNPMQYITIRLLGY